MIRIATCDDNQLQREIIRELLDEYVSLRKEPAEIVSFGAAFEMMEYRRKHGPFDIYMLDMIMPLMNGMELAKKLREDQEKGRIIFLSASADYVFDSFDVSAYYYLVKPVEPQKLFAVLDRAIAEIHEESPRIIEVDSRDGIRRVPTDSVMWVIHRNRTLHYHLKDGSRVESKVLRCGVQKMVEPLLQDPRFCMAGASMVINLSQIRSIDHGKVLLKNGTELYPPDRAINLLKAEWNKF